MRPRTAASLRRPATGLLLIPLFLLAAPASPQSPRLAASQDVPVTRSGVPHAETAFAVHPQEPGTMLAAAMTVGLQSDCAVYASRDGGATWTPVLLPDMPPYASDPQLAFTPRGTALAVCGGVVESGGRSTSPEFLWRSEDGGRSWARPLRIDSHGDHPQIAVDPDSGRVYIAIMYNRYEVGLLRSEDDGRTFTGPVQVADPAPGVGQQVSTPLVLSDGTVVFTYYSTSMLLSERGEARSQTFWTAASRDGGRTFAPPRPGPQRRVRAGVPTELLSLSSFPLAAVDRSAGPFRDRLYLVWTDFSGERPRVRLTSSADRGATWSEPREVVPGLPATASTFQPAVAVAPDGTLGVSWFDTRASSDGAAYEAWFAASLDGGVSFLPAVRLSSAPSRPLSDGNRQLSPASWRYVAGTLRLNFTTAASRFPQGGDYQGLAADRDGRFRLVWADARGGPYQLWTAAAWVERGTPAAEADGWVVAELTGEVDVVFDPASYDKEKQELLLPLRLRNVGRRPLRQPLRVYLIPPDGRYRDLEEPLLPVLVGVDDDHSRIEIDYSCALGGSQELAPGEVTAARVWRLHLPDPDNAPDLEVQVFGRVRQELADAGGEAPAAPR